MQKTSFFPPFIRTLSVLFIGTLLALVLARGAMLGILWPEVAGNPASDILNALYIGTKFDIRMVVLGLIPIALILGIPPLERLLVRSRGFRGLIDLLYAAVFAAATLVYIIDFGWFFYMHTRVDASLFELLGDPDIAGTMVWESYPVVWITFGLIVVTALYALFFGKTLARHEATPRQGFAVLSAVLRTDAHHRPRHLHHHDRHPGREPLRRHQFPQSGTGGSGADDE